MDVPPIVPLQEARKLAEAQLRTGHGRIVENQISYTGWMGVLIPDAEAEKNLIYLDCYFMIAVAMAVYVALNFLPSGYGRYATKAFGPLIPARISWFLQELPGALIPVLVYFLMDRSNMHVSNYILLTAFTVAYINRSVIHAYLIRGGKPVPLFPAFVAWLYTGLSAFNNARYLCRFSDYSAWWILSPHFMAGFAVFVLGFMINIQSDSILRGLRKVPPSSAPVDATDAAGAPQTFEKVLDENLAPDAAGPGGPMPSAHFSASRSRIGDSEEFGYKIPFGGMFQYVSCANFFGEIVMWWGFALACWSLPALTHAIFTTANLVPRALQHHQDYLLKFGDKYPKYRYAVIPFVL